jgi:hypothetical protein
MRREYVLAPLRNRTAADLKGPAFVAASSVGVARSLGLTRPGQARPGHGPLQTAERLHVPLLGPRDGQASGVRDMSSVRPGIHSRILKLRICVGR